MVPEPPEFGPDKVSEAQEILRLEAETEKFRAETRAYQMEAEKLKLENEKYKAEHDAEKVRLLEEIEKAKARNSSGLGLAPPTPPPNLSSVTSNASSGFVVVNLEEKEENPVVASIKATGTGPRMGDLEEL